MASEDITLMAHLMRRAGFGGTYSELEERVARGYEATVEDLLHPERFPPADEDLFDRYEAPSDTVGFRRSSLPRWFYNMVRTSRPLEEKMVLFWHGLFATAAVKVETNELLDAQIETFREHSLGNFRTILVELSKDPAMSFWLDNCQSHKEEPNENYGRELLELFSLGIGNYTEDDVKAAARSFTGWTFRRIGAGPYRSVFPKFEYIPEDHDDGEKEFLGETGRFNGEDVIDIIVRHPATARFIATKLHGFFVADEPNEEAIQALARVYIGSGYDIRSVMRALLLSDFFKQARFTKVKSPVETIVGVSRLAGDFDMTGDRYLAEAMPIDLMDDSVVRSVNMGQEPLNPPAVEGWHTGMEWVDSGSLIERINYASSRMGDLDRVGVRVIHERLAAGQQAFTPAELIDGCLELIGCYEVSDVTREGLVKYATQIGSRRLNVTDGREAFGRTVAGLLTLIVATPDFQLV